MVQGIRYNGFDVENKNILMLGTGDTSKAVLLALIKNKAKKIIILNRSKSNLDAAKNMFSIFSEECILEFDLLNIANLIKNIEENDIDILINTTRLGMKGFDEHLDLSFTDRMKKEAIVVEAVYNPLYTQLLTKARDRGLAIVDGFWMLVYQGVLAFEIWTALKVPDEYINKAHSIIKR
jgi:shikimate dehydrogenase